MNRARKFNSRLHDNINKSCVPSTMAGYNIQLRINQRGGIYDNGQRHSQILREQVLNLNNAGHSQRFIANDLKTSRHFVNNVLQDYNITNSSFPKSKVILQRPKMTDDVVEYIEVEKLCKPTIYSSEIRERLLLDGVVHPDNLASVSPIKRSIQKDEQIPRES